MPSPRCAASPVTSLPAITGHGPAPDQPRTPYVVARVLSVAIRGYQAVRAGRPSSCRYWPTCSDYALDALAVHGAGRGLGLVANRLLRCHPWARSGGFDPVPEPGR